MDVQLNTLNEIISRNIKDQAKKQTKADIKTGAKEHAETKVSEKKKLQIPKKQSVVPRAFAPVSGSKRVRVDPPDPLLGLRRREVKETRRSHLNFPPPRK